MTKEWISVKERIPEPGEKFIGYSKWENINIYRRREFGDKPYAFGPYAGGKLDFDKDILYWIPLPEPPKGDA